jgi:predicted small integral membrane protein
MDCFVAALFAMTAVVVLVILRWELLRASKDDRAGLSPFEGR